MCTINNPCSVILRLQTFPLQIMAILDDQETSHIISWLPNGRAFSIHNKANFANDILPKQFNNIKYPSLMRKMRRWGFVAMTTRRASKPTFCHRLFIRGDIESCRKMGPVVQEEDIPASRQPRNTNYSPQQTHQQQQMFNSSTNHSSSCNSSARATITPPSMMEAMVSQSSAAPSLDGSSISGFTQNSRGMPLLPQQTRGNVPNNINTKQQHSQQQDTSNAFASQLASQLHQQVQARYQATLQQTIASIDMVSSNARNKAAVSRGELMAFETNGGNPQISNHSAPSLQGTSRPITPNDWYSKSSLLSQVLHHVLRQESRSSYESSISTS